MTEQSNGFQRLADSTELLRAVAQTLHEANRVMEEVVRRQAAGTEQMRTASAAAKAGVAGLQRQDALLRFAQAHLSDSTIHPDVQAAIDKAVTVTEVPE
jgi:hypothetical protein